MSSQIPQKQSEEDKIFDQLSQTLQDQKGLEQCNNKREKGGFGFVSFVQDASTQKKYAVKAQSIIDTVNGSIDQDKLKMCNTEADILKNMKHKNVVEYHSDFTIGFYHFIQMNLCECSLDDWIQKRGNQPLSQNIFFHFLNQILDGIEYFHSHNYVLRDLSLRNILITSDGTIKLCDFGLTGKIEFSDVSKIMSKNPKGVFTYYPPELIQDYKDGSKIFTQSKRGDIWALGICLSLLGGLSFFDVMNFNQPDSQIKQSPLLDEFCNSIIQLILKKDPKERPSISQIRKYMYDKMVFNNELPQFEELKQQDLQIQKNLDDYYNQREIEIEVTKYRETETECLQNLNNIESLIKLGYINLYYHYNLVNALSYFMDALLLNKDDPDIYLGLAQVYIEKWNIEKNNNEKNEKIESYIQKAYEISPNYWRFYYLKFQYFFYVDNYEEADKLLKKSMEIKNHPLLKSRYYSLKALSNKQEQSKQILQEFEQENFTTKYRFYYYDLARVASYSNDLQKSLNYFEEEIKYFPNNPKSLNYIGGIYEKQNKYEEAMKYYLKSYELNTLYKDPKNKYESLKQKQSQNQSQNKKKGFFS